MRRQRQVDSPGGNDTRYFRNHYKMAEHCRTPDQHQNHTPHAQRLADRLYETSEIKVPFQRCQQKNCNSSDTPRFRGGEETCKQTSHGYDENQQRPEYLGHGPGPLLPSRSLPSGSKRWIYAAPHDNRCQE